MKKITLKHRLASAKGGYNRAKRLTKKRRSQIASKAAKRRWLMHRINNGTKKPTRKEWAQFDK